MDGEDAVGTIEFDREVNTLVHEGWSIAAPREWRFYSLQRAGTDDEVLRASTPDRRNAFSLYTIDFGLPPDVDILADYASEVLSDVGMVEESQGFPLQRVHGDEVARYWYLEAEDAGAGVILEPDEDVVWEWRYQVESSLEPVVQTIVREAERSSADWSERRTPGGYAFYSQGSRWRWVSDVGDGMMIEKRVADGETRTTVATFSLRALEDGDEWLRGMVDDATVVTGEIGITGRPVPVQGYSSYVHDRILRTVFPPESFEAVFQEASDMCVVFVVDGEVKPSPDVVFSDPEVVDLFDRYLFLPMEAEE